MASGQESTWLPFCQLELGQRMPVICLMMASMLTPERRASEMRRPVDSIWEEAQPPVLPIWAKTSQKPRLSWFTVT